ncbi:MAG: polyphosphate kinase 2 family protein [Verrucomicrobiota bacterium]|nr:polyphosphate kinase 2 family protein [Verrucomicrobiota bacterium]
MANSTNRVPADTNLNGAGRLQPISRRKKVTKCAVIAGPKTRVQLRDINPAGKPPGSKSEGEKTVARLSKRLAELQQVLYAEHERSVVIVLQGMDTGGKDGAIKAICADVDLNGIQLTNFKYPSPEEWDHDFLWRVHHAAPRKGSIAIWNRSHYEDVLVPRVHRQISDDVWRDRCDDINNFERLLTHNGVTMLKFFLRISKEEQKTRLEARLKDATKLWKFNEGDLKERALWDDYQVAYEAVVNACGTEYAPWHIVPADRKWARNVFILEAIVDALEKMAPQYPEPTFDPATIVVE